MIKFLRRIWPLGFSALLGFLFAIALLFPELSGKNQNAYKILKTKMKVLDQILSYVNHFYFDKVDFDKVMDGSFRGLMEELDPHSTYIPAKEQENISELFKGNFQGIGIEFDILDGYITVISPVPDSPSEIVGLMPGDKIIAIDKEDAYKITKSEVFKKLRGKKGSEVLVTISRIGMTKPFDVSIIRDNIPIYSVGSATMLNDKTGYIFLRRFSATTKEEVISAIDTLLSQGMERLLFDLRGNSGGYLEQAAAISDLFIDTNDTLVYTIGKIKESNQVFLSNPSKEQANNYSLVILINRGSASAAEIVSGAVQDLDRGLVIGETSFGKGLVQRQLPLDTGSAIRVTIARYYTPSGRSIQSLGVSPDIIVESRPRLNEKELEKMREGRKRLTESDLRGALSNDSLTEEEKQQIELEREKQEETAERRQDDYQIAFAMDILEGLSIYEVDTD